MPDALLSPSISEVIAKISGGFDQVHIPEPRLTPGPLSREQFVSCPRRGERRSTRRQNE